MRFDTICSVLGIDLSLVDVSESDVMAVWAGFRQLVIHLSDKGAWNWRTGSYELPLISVVDYLKSDVGYRYIPRRLTEEDVCFGFEASEKYGKAGMFVSPGIRFDYESAMAEYGILPGLLAFLYWEGGLTADNAFLSYCDDENLFKFTEDGELRPDWTDF
jgi:hypothetical protein